MSRNSNPDDVALTEKQMAVLDLVLQHQSSKDIARALGISPYTVDQRIAAARKKYGVDSRAELARAYAQARMTCERTAYDYSYVVESEPFPDDARQDVPEEPVLSLADAVPLHWNNEPPLKPLMMAGLEAMDDRFGPVSRVAIVGLLAVVIAICGLVIAALAETLTRLV